MHPYILFEESVLWDVIVNNDIGFAHILPRLNFKFFYRVNTATRVFTNRAVLSGIELTETFKVRKISSISTLGFA